jgi:hypothetical protein
MLGHQYSATGGQLDFVRGAYASRGGKSIIACHSTAAKGRVSRIVPRLDGPVTTPRIDTHIDAYRLAELTIVDCEETKISSAANKAPAGSQARVYLYPNRQLGNLRSRAKSGPGTVFTLCRYLE